MNANTNHSTGPRTPAGIENCKYNAIKHGLTGQQLVLKSENPADYDALRASLIEEHQPASESEAMLVERIAQNYWKILRAERYERTLLNYGEVNDDCPFDTKRFLTFLRYRNAIERAWNKATKDLAALKAETRNAAAALVPKLVKAVVSIPAQPPGQSVLYKSATASQPAASESRAG